MPVSYTDACVTYRELAVVENRIIFYLRGQKPLSPLQKYNPDVSISIFYSDNAAQCLVKNVSNCSLSRQQQNSCSYLCHPTKHFVFLNCHNIDSCGFDCLQLRHRIPVSVLGANLRIASVFKSNQQKAKLFYGCYRRVNRLLALGWVSPVPAEVV